MRSKIFFPGILLLLILLFSVKSYASNGVSADWPYEETMCNDNPNNPYYWLPFSEESSVSLLDYALDIDNPRTGYVISPFEGDVEYSLNLQLLSGVQNGQYPDGDPTNCIPIGSEWPLFIGIVCLILARLVKLLLVRKCD